MSDSLNPYVAPTSDLKRPQDVSSRRSSRFSYICLYPGCLLGFLLGSCVALGVHGTYEAIINYPGKVIPSLALMPLVCILLTFVWRIPRRFIFGRHLKSRTACFVSGLILGTGVSVGMTLLEKVGIINSNQGLKVFWISLVATAGAFMVLAVECEAMLSKSLLPRATEREE